jgi:hypothetical protein
MKRKAFDWKDLLQGSRHWADADAICWNNIGDGVVARRGIDVRGTSI